MQPRSLQAVLTELDNVYNPQLERLRQQQAAVPQSAEADIQQAEGQRVRAFDDILQGARRRGTGVAFGGIPLHEQARYSSDVFAPSILKAKDNARNRANSLEDAIFGINQQRMQQGQGIYQNEQQMFEQRRQFDEQQKLAREQMAAQQREAERQHAAARASAGGGRITPTMSGGGRPPQSAPSMGKAVRKQDGGFAFTDAGGKPISAAMYAQANKQDIRDVLYQMGQSGDQYSQKLYNQLAQDRQFGRGNAQYDRKIMQAYSPIFWGTF